MIKKLAISFLALCLVSFCFANDESKRGVMEQTLFPLLKEADNIEILAVYPVTLDKNRKQKPDAAELSTVFGLQGKDADKNMTDADRKIAEMARKAPIVEGYPVLGKVVITEKKDIDDLLGDIRRMAVAQGDEGVQLMDCHEPRHALRITKGNQTLHFSICFDCRNSFIRGLPAGKKQTEFGFHHFKDGLRKILEAHLTAKEVPFLKPPEVK